MAFGMFHGRSLHVVITLLDVYSQEHRIELKLFVVYLIVHNYESVFATVASQHNQFRTMWPDHAKGLSVAEPSEIVNFDLVGSHSSIDYVQLHIVSANASGLYGDDLSHPSSSMDCKYMYSCLVFVFQRESHTKVFHRLTFYSTLKILRLHQRLLWISEEIPSFFQVLF